MKVERQPTVLLEQAERPLRSTLNRRITILIRVIAIRPYRIITMCLVTRQNRTIMGRRRRQRPPRPPRLIPMLRTIIMGNKQLITRRRLRQLITM